MEFRNFLFLRLTQLMPRRIPDYPDAYAGWNSIASYGSYVSVMSLFVLIWVIFTMTYTPTKAFLPAVKDSFWAINGFYSLENCKHSPFGATGNVANKAKTNFSSLEFSINTPPCYHSFTQSPIMG